MLVLTVCYKLISCVFQIFPLFIPDMLASFTYFIVRTVPIYLAQIL
jgi:hypothetical protein